MSLRHAQGGLVSFGGITFVLGRSKPLPNIGMVADTNHTQSAGVLKVDRLGNGIAPLDFVVGWEYLAYASPSMTNSLKDAQTIYDSLVNLIHTAPVQTLTAFALGNSADHITGLARLVSVTPTNDDVNFKLLDLIFFCEAGMS